MIFVLTFMTRVILFTVLRNNFKLAKQRFVYSMGYSWLDTEVVQPLDVTMVCRSISAANTHVDAYPIIVATSMAQTGIV